MSKKANKKEQRLKNKTNLRERISKVFRTSWKLISALGSILPFLLLLVEYHRQIAVILMMVFTSIGTAGFPYLPRLSQSTQSTPIPSAVSVVLRVVCSVSVTIGRLATVQVVPSVIDGNNPSGQFLCLIETPAPFAWNVTQINTSSIKMNRTICPLTVDTRYYENGTAFLEARFFTVSLIYLLELENENPITTKTVTLSINGTTIYGYFWGYGEALFNYTL
jgi:hypothetical protein